MPSTYLGDNIRLARDKGKDMPQEQTSMGNLRPKIMQIVIRNAHSFKTTRKAPKDNGAVTIRIKCPIGSTYQ